MDEENDLDVTQGNELGDAAGNVKDKVQKGKETAQKAKQTAQDVKKVADKFKKGKKVAKAGKAAAKAGKAAANIGKAAGHLSKLGPALPYVLIAIVIIIVVIGLVGFLMSMPGMLTGKIKEFAQNVADWFQALYTSQTYAKVNDDDIVNTANYLKTMGYDLIGYGFIPANEKYSETYKTAAQLEAEGYVSEGSGKYKKDGAYLDDKYIGYDGIIYNGTTGEKDDSEEAGTYVDKYGIIYLAGGSEEGATGTYETSGDIKEFSTDTDTSLLRTYLMSDTRQFIIRNFDGSFWDGLARGATAVLTARYI